MNECPTQTMNILDLELAIFFHTHRMVLVAFFRSIKLRMIISAIVNSNFLKFYILAIGLLHIID